MKIRGAVLAMSLGLVFPCLCWGQKQGQVACTQQDGYTQLYSSVTTMEIRGTVKCGERVEIVERYDNFVHVRTDRGEEGYVAASALLFVKAAATVKQPAARAKKRDGAASGPESPRTSTPPAPVPPLELILARQTPVRLKLGRELSSATVHVGEEVNFEVAQDVIVGGLIVIAKGAPAIGAVSEAEPKKRMGKAGKVNVQVNSVVLANNEKIALRSFGIEQDADQKSGMNLPIMRGKDVTLAKGAEITAYVDGDQHLKISSFAAAPAATQAQADIPKP
jgi:Bacterial SH3 domain